MGLFYPHLKSKAKIIGVEAAGEGLNTKYHAASLTKGRVGVLNRRPIDVLGRAHTGGALQTPAFIQARY